MSHEDHLPGIEVEDSPPPVDRTVARGISNKLIGPEVAKRLLAAVPELHPALAANLRQKAGSGQGETIPPSLRYADDFSPGERVVFRQSESGSSWQFRRLDEIRTLGSDTFALVTSGPITSFVNIKSLDLWRKTDFLYLEFEKNANDRKPRWTTFCADLERYMQPENRDSIKRFARYFHQRW